MDEEPVAAARVQIWPGNDPSASAAVPWELGSPFADADGTFAVPSGIIYACSPFAARVWTDFDPPETYATYQFGIVVAGDTPFSDTLPSVSYSTIQLLPLTAGVELQPGMAIAAGRMTDCVGDAIANGEASVGVIDWATGSVTPPADGYTMRYFVDQEPSGDQNQISDDGLFAAINVSSAQTLSLLTWGIPQDEIHCETTTGGDAIWSTDNTALCLLAYSTITVQADAVNIGDVLLRPYPDSCAGEGFTEVCSGPGPADCPECYDGIDNDNDGGADCDDPEAINWNGSLMGSCAAVRSYDGDPSTDCP
ncbi:MAG: hypothetical protein CL928_15980 [Deltaproteobacteria bacterium]|nr:hypothetical protein [Deltaproteobacteria bacterium]